MSWINLTALWKILVFGLIAGAGLPALFGGPEEHAVRVIEEKWCAELPQETRRFARELALRYTGLYALKFSRRRGYRNDHFWAAKGR